MSFPERKDAMTLPRARWIAAAATLAATLLASTVLIAAGGAAPAAATPVAVVELFTSEGCSSCPPADTLLGELSTDHRAGLFPLAFHVDYWDRLGWADPYASAASTRRQYAYAKAFGSEQVYTPQMVVNGRSEFVGSNRARAADAIKSALKQPAAAVVDLTAKRDGRTLTITYAVKAPAGSVLTLAAAERGLATKVRRGENAGKTLRHENVVRAFATVPLSGEGTGRATLDLPADASPANITIVAYAQNPNTMSVLGASAAPLRP